MTETEAPLRVGTAYGIPVVKFTEDFSADTGPEMRDRIVAALKEHTNAVHPQYSDGQ